MTDEQRATLAARIEAERAAAEAKLAEVELARIAANAEYDEAHARASAAWGRDADRSRSEPQDAELFAKASEETERLYRALCTQIDAERGLRARIAEMADVDNEIERRIAAPTKRRSSSMSKTTTTGPTRTLIIEMLRENGPMHVKAITEKLLASGKTGLKGKTPQATIAAQLVTLANKGDTFIKTAPATFGLLDAPAAASEPTPAEEPTPEPEAAPAEDLAEATTARARKAKGQAAPDSKKKSAPKKSGRKGKAAAKAAA